MEFTKENMRFYIFIRCKLGESAKLIHETLQTVCGDCACSDQTVCRWVEEFIEGKESISGCPRPGRPKSCVNEQTIDSIKKGIDEDPHISVPELNDTNGLSPDLALYDFWLLTILKNRLAGQKFDGIQDLTKAVNSEPRTVPEEDYQVVFRKWQIRLKRCIESHGEYFEEL
ncbi:transposase [Elysia marginata]|uniref:Transposase n=1 Tax=Elysia marginata TaxID=1093978 RepID=A0AAV4H233_9GAST|nr:transposase [Elysia marginata]